MDSQEKIWEDKFHECLTLEFSQPSYFVAHHLLVITYMLQTDNYSNQTFIAAVDLLEKFLSKEADPRLIAEGLISSKPASFRNQGEKNIDKFKWTLSIMNIRTDTAELYDSDVIEWAKSVFEIFKKARLLFVLGFLVFCIFYKADASKKENGSYHHGKNNCLHILCA